MSKGSGGGTQVTRVEPSSLQGPRLADIYQQAQDEIEKLEENIAPDIKEKLKKRTLQKDPSLKSHLIYNNEKEAEKLVSLHVI